MRDNAPSHLRRVLASAPEAVAPEDADEFGLPDGDVGVYQPYARATNKPVFSLHLVTAAGEVHSFQYLHLDSNSSFTDSGVTLRFMGMRPVNVQIVGRNLWRLYDYIHQHKMQWVLEIPPGRDFVKDGDPVVTAIRIVDAREALRAEKGARKG